MKQEYSQDSQKNTKTKSGLEKNPTKIDLQQEELAFLKEENQKSKKNKAEQKYYRGKNAVDFLQMKKKEMKNNKYRQKFDTLYDEIDANLVNTEEQNPSANRNGDVTGKTWTPVMMPFNGGKNYRHIYTLQDASTSTSSLPTSFEPYTFSKVLVATALFGAKIPDAEFTAQDNVWAEAMFRLWKQTWKNKDGNGKQALEAFVQNNFLYGWSAMRTYPKRIQQMTKGVPRIKFDDIYRQVLKPNRTWLGVGYSNSDRWSQVEFLFEEDMPYDIFCTLFPDAPKDKLDFVKTGSAEDDTGSSDAKHVTITHYENELTNTFIKACGDYVIYDGELLNEDGNVDIEVANCWVRDQNDPYGVGLYELARSNERVANHLRLLNIEQMEAEVRPLLFGATFGNGEMTYKRGSNIINPKPQGTSLDVVNTNGNVAMGMSVVKSEKNSLDAITGINDVVSGLGSESTLGATVLAAEAAQQRLLLPRNSIIRALEKDAEITVSFIEQVYPEYYIFEAKDEEEAQRFVDVNESYVTQTTQVKDKYFVLASKKLAIDFDFDIESINEDEAEVGIEVEDLDAPVVVSRHALFQQLDELKNRVNLSRVLDVQIDATTMMMPSEEMKKQNVMTLYPLISESTTMIMQAAKEDPDLASAMLKQTMTLLRTFRLDPYDWLPKDIVNGVIAGELVDDDMIALAKMNQQNELQEQMAQAGLPGQQAPTMEGMIGGQGQAMAQNPMNASMNASVGRAASGAPSPEQTVDM